MPRVNPLTVEAKIQENMKKQTRQLRHELEDAGISLTKIAAVLNVSPQAVSQQFRAGRLTAEAFICCEMLLRGEI